MDVPQLAFGTCLLDDEATAYMSSSHSSTDLVVSGNLASAAECELGLLLDMIRIPADRASEFEMYAHVVSNPRSGTAGTVLRGQGPAELNLRGGGDYSITDFEFEIDFDQNLFLFGGVMEMPLLGPTFMSGSMGPQGGTFASAMDWQVINPTTGSVFIFDVASQAEIASGGTLSLTQLATLTYCPNGNMTACIAFDDTYDLDPDGSLVVCDNNFFIEGDAVQMATQRGCIDFGIWNREDGESCAGVGVGGEFCKSGRCEGGASGTCAPRQPNGASCNENSDCFEASYCTGDFESAGRCEAKKKLDEACVDDKECWSNHVRIVRLEPVR